MFICRKRLKGLGSLAVDNRLSRRQMIVSLSGSVISASAFLSIGGLAAGVSRTAQGQEQAQAEPQQESRIKRIKMGTIGCRDLAATEDWYSKWIGYTVVERGRISEALAGSWGTANMAGRAYILMQPESGADVFIRAVETDGIDGYKAMTTFGWNSFEIIVEDVYALNERILKSPFEIIGGPEPIFPDSTIHAMQVIGPSQEVLYLTQEANPEAKLLPDPGSFVDRPFIMVLACPDVAAVVDFYASKFGVTGGGGADEGVAIGIISSAQGLPEDHKFQMGFMQFANHGHYLEIDGYPDSATTRPRAGGQLPPGNAMCSFNVEDLDEFDVDFISAPVRDNSLAYGDHRSATLVGPAGELTELIEAPI